MILILIISLIILILPNINGQHFLSPSLAPSTNITMSFLETYGYLPKHTENELNLISHQELERAIKLMQKFANLPQTGQIDQITLKTMLSARCGLPDLSPEYSWQQRKNNRSKRFVVYGPKWNKMPIYWSLNHPSRKVPIDRARETFSRAWKFWSQASNKLQFVETNDHNADILIGFYTGNHGCGSRQSFDGPGIKLAHAYAPPNGDVHFDDDEDWINETVSLYWAALHEFGHALGFAHTADQSSIMFPYYRDYGDNFKMPEVDKAGVRYLYGDLETSETSGDKMPLPKPTPVTPIDSGDDEGTGTTTHQPRIENFMCQTNIDAIASIRNEIFVFKNKSFWWVKNDLSLIRKEPIPISQYFLGFPPDIDHVDAVYERKSDQLIMFFVGRYYYLFNANQFHDGPRPLTEIGLPEQIDKIDAVTDWGLNGRIYIFTGPVYWRMDAEERRVQEDYPRDMSVWRGVPIHLDAAFTWRFDSKTYFFKNQFYWKFNNEEMQTDNNDDDPENPSRIRDFLFRSIDCSNEQQQPHNYRKFYARSYDSSNAVNVIFHFSNNFIILVITLFYFYWSSDQML